MKTTPTTPIKYFVGRMIIDGKKVVRVMRRRFVTRKRRTYFGTTIGEKTAVFEVASATWIAAPAKFVQVSNLLATRKEARAEKRAWEGRAVAAK